MPILVRRGGLVAAALLAGLVAAATPRLAHAQDKAAAEALFDQGRRQLEAKDFVAACRSFEDSQKLDPGIGTLLYLADCYEKGGRTASAWATFREAESTAKAAGQGEREQIARRRAAALEPTLSRVVVTSAPENEVPGFEVRRDGEPLVRAVWGTPVPYDPGEHEVAATAPGRKPWRATVTVPAGPATVSLAIPKLETDGAPAASAPAPAGPSAPPRAPTEPERAGGGQRTAALVVGGVGVAGVVVGSIFGLRASAKNDDADAHCLPSDPTRCTKAGADLGDEAKSAATVSTLAFGLGGAALATGVVLWLTAPSAEEGAHAVQLRAAPMVAQGGAGIALEGRLW